MIIIYINIVGLFDIFIINCNYNVRIVKDYTALPYSRRTRAMNDILFQRCSNIFSKVSKRKAKGQKPQGHLFPSVM